MHESSPLDCAPTSSEGSIGSMKANIVHNFCTIATEVADIIGKNWNWPGRSRNIKFRKGTARSMLAYG